MPILHLKSLPKDLNDYILKLQYQQKIKKELYNYSKEKVVHQIIREHKEMKEKFK